MADQKNTNLRYNLRWLASCLIFLFTSCKNNTTQLQSIKITAVDSIKKQIRINNAFVKIESASKKIESGDLIVRTGNDFTSESLRRLNQRNQTYSHCGIASVENDTVFVYHALGGEWNPNQKIKREWLNFFTEPYSNRGFAVYRYPLNGTDIKSLIQTVKKLYSLGIVFDMNFDLKTNDSMYCAEFVYKAYVMGTNGKLQFSTSQLGDFIFIGVDDLFLQPLCVEQQKILY